jgi:hypothetical protein
MFQVAAHVAAPKALDHSLPELVTSRQRFLQKPRKMHPMAKSRIKQHLPGSGTGINRLESQLALCCLL